MDITACVNSECEKRNNCLRFRLIYGGLQSISFFDYDNDVCFIEVYNDDKLNSLEVADRNAKEMCCNMFHK